MRTKTKLLPHQIPAVEKMMKSRIGALFMEMGLGKTRTAIEIVFRRHTRIKNIVWFCPVSLKQTIKQEILKHTGCTDDDIFVFDNKVSSRSIPSKFWYIIGIESISSSSRVLFAANKLILPTTMVVVDESSYIKGHASKRTMRITQISEKSMYRLILTGTPISQGIVDLFSQMRFLSPKILGYRSFYSFAANHLEYSDKYPGMIVRANNTGLIASKIQPYVYQVTKKECLDLPPKLFKARYFSMTAEQEYYYNEAKQELLMEIDDADFSSIAIFRLFTTLQQIVCGFWNRNGERIEFKHRRIWALVDIINGIPSDEKVIIWAKYRYDIESISKALACEFSCDKIALYHGGIIESKRADQERLFRKEARFFLGTQKCGGHGLTLNEANYVIFYNNGFKYSDRLQAEDRCHRIGQDMPVTYIDIRCCDSIDTRISKALESKESVVDSFKRQVDKVKDKKSIKEIMKAL